MKPYLSVIIPAYKEEKRLPSTLSRLREYFYHERTEQYSFEILVVVDGSPDDTAGVVRRAQIDFPELRLIDRAENKGKGYTIIEGMQAAMGEVRLFMDSDNSTDIAHLDLFLPHFRSGVNVVIGSRRCVGAVIRKPQGFFRRLLSRLGNLLIQSMVLPGISDTQCGFKAMTEDVAQKVFPLMVVHGWGFDIEMLSLAKRYGYAIQEVGVEWTNDEASTLKSSAFVVTLHDLFLLRFRLWFGNYPRR